MNNQKYEQMKSQLIKLKFKYNEVGNYDKEKFLNESKKIYASEIQTAIYTDQVTDDNFPIKKLHTDFLQSMVLKDDPKFKQIKKIMHQYNGEVDYYKGKSAKGLHLKPKVMDSMLKFMRLMLLAHDTQSKKKILDVSYGWFLKNLKPASQKKSIQTLKNQIREIAIQQKLLSTQLINKQLPSDIVKEIMKHYQGNTRTIYNQIDAPYDQIKNYNTRKVGILDHRISEGQQNKDKSQEKWLQRVKFKRPYINRFTEQDLATQPIQQISKIQQQPKISQNQDGTINKQNQNIQLKKEGQGQNIIKSVPQGQIENQNPPLDQLDFGLGGQDQQQENQQPQIQQQDKAKGKLDPFVKVFMLKKLEKLRKQQIQAEKKFQFNRNKYHSQYSKDVQFASQIGDWASRKGRLKTEMSKKLQTRQGIRRIVSYSLDQKKNVVEHTMNKLKLNRTISQAKKYTGQIKKERLNTQPSLSVYDRKRIKTQESKNQFSQILSQNTRAKIKQTFLDEIDDIKMKFAKYKLYAPMNKLITGLAPQPEKDQAQTSKLLDLPVPMLPSNPFFKVGKKKKKKKKKK